MRAVLPHDLRSRLARPVVWRRLVVGLLLVWGCLAVVRLVVVGTRPGPVLAPPVAGPAASAAVEGTARPDIETLVSWQLFGGAPESTAAPLPVAQPGIEERAETTGLDLVLEGLVAADQTSLARAIIRHRDQRQQYQVGDKLPVAGTVRVARILVDRVILDNGGRYESLWLYSPEKSDGAAPPLLMLQAAPAPPATRQAKPPASTAVDMRGNAEATGAASALRAKLYSDPATLAEAFRVTVAREGDRVVGYRLAPGQDPEQFRRLGLQTGDVLLRVNGAPVSDPRRMLELYAMLRFAREATATVRRDGAELTLHMRLDNAQ